MKRNLATFVANYRQRNRSVSARAARFDQKTLTVCASVGLPETLTVRAAAGSAPVEILLYDEIGYWGVTAKDFVLALAAAGDGPITLRINSPGGDVFDGLAIFNALKARTSPVNVVVDGIAASAASFIAMAGTTITMAEQSMLMIHNAWGICCGDRHDMAAMSTIMGKIDGQLAAIYAKRSDKPVGDFVAIMDAETWLTSSEAKDAGLCDTVGTTEAVAENAADKVFASTGRDLRALLVNDDQDDDATVAELIQTAMATLSEALDVVVGDNDDGPIDPAALAADEITAEAAALAAAATKSHLQARRMRLRVAEAEAV